MFDVAGACRHYPVRRDTGGFRGKLRAVDGVDLKTRAGETLAIVGESGCGKSTLARLLLRLEMPTAGTVSFDGSDLWCMGRDEVSRFRRQVQLVFQDPYASLNPRMRVGDIVGEPLAIHGLASGAARGRRVEQLLDQVGLPSDGGRRFPHELSGGQRQRVGIARALAVEPKLIVADEPVSALDVSIQAQILNLLGDLQESRGLAYVFITHDLRVVRHVAHRVAVMYLGRIVEEGTPEDLFGAPLHPYTRALLDAVPSADPSQRSPCRPLQGELPSPIAPPPGCAFHTRCPRVFERCRSSSPRPISSAGERLVACHLYG